MSEVVKRLRERRANVWEQAKALADRAADENRNFNGEEQSSWDTLNAELDALDKRIKAVIDGEQRAKETEEAFSRLEAKPDQRGGDQAADDESPEVAQVRAMLRGEAGAPRGIEVNPTGRTNFRTLSKLTAGAGANTVKTSFYDQLVQNMIETSAVLQAGVTILRTSSGETMQVPKTTSHSTAAIVAEAASIGVSDPSFGQASLGAFKYGVMVQLSRELVDDASVDLEGYLAMETGRALGNAFGAHLVTGTGTNQPRGILADTTLGVTTATGTSGVPTADNMLDLYYSVIAPYRNASSAAYLMKDTTVAALRKVKDTTGQYLWQPSLQAGAPDRFGSVPILTDPFMPATALNAKSVVFGDFSRYFVRLVGGIRFERSDEFAFSTDLITYRALLRGDGALMDTTGALKHIVGAAT
ncbi:phage major capsid protein [Terrabacter terrigena]|uniref:Phage major capsid protein n=1 Tax=Terrabacter terrigena TaxID=574718 RepID=A0ABW3N0X1_9MICO